MGMFDEYYHEVVCPHCGNTQSYWQGKDGPCVGSRFYPGDFIPYRSEGVLHIYEMCGWPSRQSTPRHWIDALAVVHEGRWIATIVTRVTEDGGAGKEIWSIRKKE